MGKGQELLDAARNGDIAVVDKILGQIARRSGPFTREIVQLLLAAEASASVVDQNGATPLHLAAWAGHGDIVRMLLAHKNPPVNVDLPMSSMETALHCAAEFGHVGIVAQLLDRGASVTVKNKRDETPLDLAAQYGRLETVQHLLAARPQLVDPYRAPSSRGRLFPHTPLHRASKNGHKEVVATLIAAGVDPNVKTTSGTALHEAALCGKDGVVRTLLARGADLNAGDRRGRTVRDLLAEFKPEATRRVRHAIDRYLHSRGFDSDEELPAIPVNDHSPLYENTYPRPRRSPSDVYDDERRVSSASMNPNRSPAFTNHTNSDKMPSQLTNNASQNFVKKLASRFKAKFNSAPNISNAGVDIENKQTDLNKKSSTNTVYIGNSKFFKRLSKKEESGDIACNDEFDTISLDRVTLDRTLPTNRSNRSCPGFKISLPNISENTELSDSQESLHESTNVIRNVPDLVETAEAIKADVIEAYNSKNRFSKNSLTVNEFYESYAFDLKEETNASLFNIQPAPRNTIERNLDRVLYENISIQDIPKPAARSFLPQVDFALTGHNLSNKHDNCIESPLIVKPEPAKRSFVPISENVSNKPLHSESPFSSRSSTLSGDSNIDESNFEDILLSKKSMSFRRPEKHITNDTSRKDLDRSESLNSTASFFTEASALENVDCTEDYLPMTGTLPKRTVEKTKRKILFRHKTFSTALPDKVLREKSNATFESEFLSNYHIRGTGHCIYKSPTVEEFIYIFNRDTLTEVNAPPFIKVPNNRESLIETAICFCKQNTLKQYNSADDLLDIEKKDTLSILNFENLEKHRELNQTSFQCYCNDGSCQFHLNKRKLRNNLVIKFSALQKSMSTPDVSIDSSLKVKPKRNVLHFEGPYAVVDIIGQNYQDDKKKSVGFKSAPSTLRSPRLQRDLSRDESFKSANSSNDTSLTFGILSQPSTLTSTWGEDHSKYYVPNNLSFVDVSSKFSTMSSDHSSNTLEFPNQEFTKHASFASEASFKSCLDFSDSSDDDSSSDGLEFVKSSWSYRKSDNFDEFVKNSLESQNVMSVDEENNSSNLTVNYVDSNKKAVRKESLKGKVKLNIDTIIENDEAATAIVETNVNSRPKSGDASSNANEAVTLVNEDFSNNKNKNIAIANANIADCINASSPETCEENISRGFIKHKKPISTDLCLDLVDALAANVGLYPNLSDIIANSKQDLDNVNLCSENYSNGCDSKIEAGIPTVSSVLGMASLDVALGVGGVCSGRRWDEGGEGTSEGDALSVSSAASSSAPHHLIHHHLEYSKVSPTPPKKPPRRNLSVSPTHVNSPASSYCYDLRGHTRSQDDLDDIQGAKNYLKHGRSVDQYVDSKNYSEYEETQSTRALPVPNPRPSLKLIKEPVAITRTYENVMIKEQNPRRKIKRNNFARPYENCEPGMAEKRKYQERSSIESLLDEQSLNSPDCDRVPIPLSPTHYDQPPTPEHPPPSAKQAENSIHERIRPLSQEYKRRSYKRDSFTETDAALLRVASEASVASGATDRSANTDNCVEEYVCDVPFAGLFKGSTTTLDGIGLRPMPAERPKTLRKLKSVYDASPTDTHNDFPSLQFDQRLSSNGTNGHIDDDVVRRRSNTTSSNHSADKSLSILSPFDEQEEWAKISEIMASFGSKLVRESVFVSELEQEFTSRLGLSCSESSLSVPCSGVGSWLTSIGYGDYESLFLDSGYDNIVFINGVIDENDIREMGIEESVSLKILESIKQLPLKILEISNNCNNNKLEECSVEEWLKLINLEQYSDTFRKHLYIDMDRVKRIWEVELTAVLEIHKAGHRKRILASVSGQQNGPISNLDGINCDLNKLKTNILHVKDNTKEKLPKDTKSLVLPGGETLKRSKKNRPAPQPPRPSDLEIRAPSELLVGVPGALKAQWRHQPFVLVSGAVTYVANYLGSTVVKELRGTESTKKSIQKLKKSTKEHRDSPDIILSISYRGVKFLNTITKELICEHEIRNIHCACQDADDMTHFAYLTKDHATKSHYCHVFCVATMDQATEVILTLGEAFEVAYQMALRDQSLRIKPQTKTPTHDPSSLNKEKQTVNHGRSHSITEIKLNGHQLKIAPIPSSQSNEDFQNKDGARSPRTPILKAPIASTEEL